MKKLSFPAIAILLTMITVGCNPVYSLKPYYTEANKIEVPEKFIGTWEAKLDDDGLERCVVTLDKKGELRVLETYKNPDKTLSAQLDVQFFEVNKQMYFDAVLKELPEGTIPASASLTLVPVHALLRVKMVGELMEICYPSMDEKDIPAELTYVTFEDKGDGKARIIFTAPGGVWEKVLTETPEKFFKPDDKGMLFKKQEEKKQND